jgi:hypothetical protein
MSICYDEVFVVYEEFPIREGVRVRKIIVLRDTINDAIKVKKVLEETDVDFSLYGVERYTEEYNKGKSI